MNVQEATETIECSCYGCVIARQHAGMPSPDRSAEPCDPPSACATTGRCWTHSEWSDEPACDPLNARECSDVEGPKS